MAKADVEHHRLVLVQQRRRGRADAPLRLEHVGRALQYRRLVGTALDENRPAAHPPGQALALEQIEVAPDGHL
jgi:hypothetical protein